MVSKAATVALQVVGYIFALCEAIAPSLFTFRRIITEQDVGPNTCLPYEFMWLNGIFELSYAIRTHDKGAISVYAIVVIMTSAYCLVYLRYSTGVHRLLSLWFFALKIFVVVGVPVMEIRFYGHEDTSKERAELHDVLALVTTMLIYFSPIKEVLDAFRTHEVGGVDILLSLAFFANATIGTVSACLPFHTLPAVCGVIAMICTSGECFVWLRCKCHGHQVA